MSITNVISTLHSFSFVPYKSICRGKEVSGKIKIDFYIDSEVNIKGLVIREKLKEAKADGTVIFTKAGEKSKLSAELIKENKPVSNPPKVKVKQ